MSSKQINQQQHDARIGIILALSCYIFWGLFPLYWHVLGSYGLAPQQILAQRIFWSSVFALLLLIIFKQQSAFIQAFKQPRSLLTLYFSAHRRFYQWIG